MASMSGLSAMNAAAKDAVTVSAWTTIASRYVRSASTGTRSPPSTRTT